MTEEQAQKIVSTIVNDMQDSVRKLIALGREIASDDKEFDEEAYRLECAKAFYHYYQHVLKPHVFTQFPHLDLSQEN